MMNVKLIIGIALSMAAFGATANEAVSPAHENNFQEISTAKAASHDQAVQLASDILIKEEARRHTIDQAVAPIGSRGDLHEYLVTHRTVASPLNALSPSLRQVFLSSLTFNENGITGFRYDVLETLTATQIYKILSLFGAQGFTSQLTNATIITPTDSLIMSPFMRQGDFLKGYRCESKGTCTASAQEACTSNC